MYILPSKGTSAFAAGIKESHMLSYCLIGSPIAHSLSPAMMNRSFDLLGIDARYSLVETDEEGLQETVERLKESGFSGWNVTMPVKRKMASLCDELTLEASIGGAVNTVINKNGRLTGMSTDGSGLISALKRRGMDPETRSAVLLGSGGAASSILISLALCGAGSIFVYSRSSSGAEKMRDVAAKLGGLSKSRISVRLLAERDALKRDLSDSSLLINATSAGMEGGPDPDGSPIGDPTILPDGIFVYDIIYHPLTTPLLAEAGRRGLPCEGGVSMLIGQGAESFRAWTGLEMPYDEIRELIMSRI